MREEELSHIYYTCFIRGINSAPITLEIQLIRYVNLCCRGKVVLQDKGLAAVDIKCTVHYGER